MVQCSTVQSYVALVCTTVMQSSLIQTSYESEFVGFNLQSSSEIISCYFLFKCEICCICFRDYGYYLHTCSNFKDTTHSFTSGWLDFCSSSSTSMFFVD